MSPLAAALGRVAAALDGARDPWWVIGSAAARLHGAVTSVANVDVLLSAHDATAVLAAWRGAIVIGAPGERFRSSPFARLQGATLPIELMAGLEVHEERHGRAVRPVTRQALAGVYVPEREELAALFALFGRDKDLARADLLRASATRSGSV